MSEIIIFAADSYDIRVSRAFFKNIDRVDVRTFMDIAGERRPTKKGVSLPLDHLPDLIAALQTLARGAGDA